MIQKTLAYYLRLRYWQQRRKGFGLLHEVGTRLTFRVVDGRLFIRKAKTPIQPANSPTNTKRAYNTLTKEWEE